MDDDTPARFVMSQVFKIMVGFKVEPPIINKAKQFGSSIFMCRQRGSPYLDTSGWVYAVCFILSGGILLQILRRVPLPLLGQYLHF